MTCIIFISVLCIVILVLQHYLFQNIIKTYFYVQKTIRNNSKQIKKIVNSTLILALSLGVFACNPSESIEEVTEEVAIKNSDISRKTTINIEKDDASVPIDYELPKEIKYEIVEYLFIPDEYNQDGTLRSKTNIPEHLVEELVTISLTLTDNLDKEKGASNNKNSLETPQIMRSSWRPAGQIFFVENYNPGTGIVNRTSPLVGASVRARRWHITHRGLTDNNGRFSCDGTFKRDANYSIKWERQDFDIRSGTFGQAIFNGSKQKGDWNLTISSGESRNYAIVHTAAQEYYYGNRFGLKSPPRNGFWNSRLKIKVSNNNRSFHCKDCRTFGAIPRLVIGNLGRTADQIYGTTIHEIAHSSHWELRREEWNNNNTEERLKESWAQGVEWLFTTRRYRGYNSAYVFQSDYQWRTPVENPVYTSLMVDLNDNFDQSINVTNAAGQLLPIDRVAGYTFLQMENILNNSDGFNQFRQQLIIQYNNPTEPFLVELFNNWN